MRLGFAVAQEAVITESNLVYGAAVDYSGSNVSLTLDAYYVNSTRTNRPVVMLTHGGGFSGGDKGYTVSQGNFYPDMATAFASNGFVVFSINYRLWPGCSGSCTQELDMAVEDVMTALGWIRAHSAYYGIDATRVLIGGDSAGGGLAVNASYRGTNVNSFLGCISLWGGLPPYGNDVHPVNACPISSQTPPTCAIHGTADTVVPYAISVNLSSNLTTSAVYNELHPLAGYNHYPVMADNVYDTNLVGTIISYMIAFANLTTGRLQPAAPVPSAATAILSDGFTANWGVSANASGYLLDVTTNGGFTSFVLGYDNLDVGNVTNRVVTGLIPGTAYYYRVRAYDGNGSSGNSSTIMVITATGPRHGRPVKGGRAAMDLYFDL
jgi:acetyl esterase/lipase